MQKNNELVVGLDIGTTKICAIVGRKNEFGKLEILGMGTAVSEGVIRGMVTNINSTMQSIVKAVKEAEDQSGVNIEVVNVGIAGQHIRSSVHHGSRTRHNGEDEISVDDVTQLTMDMYKTVFPLGNEIIHVMPQVYTVDGVEKINDPVGMIGVRLQADFHVITAQTNAIKNIKKCIDKSNLKIDELILEPIASSLSVLTKEEKEAGIVLVDIGGGTTDVAIFYDNIIRHTAVIPFGGNIITSDITEGCKVMQKQAEQLKVKYGSAMSSMTKPNEIISIQALKDRPNKEISRKNLAQVIEARMTEIVEMVHMEIVNSGYYNKIAGGIVITGGGSQLANAKQLFELITGMDVRIGHPNEHLGKSKMEEVKSPMYATAIGLVLAGFWSIDERENKYSEVVSDKVGGTKKSSSQPALKVSDFTKKISERIKGFMLDDYNDTDFKS
ncbi:MAG: ftsA [Chitinophagaceae bacterium]|nr:ftsA [Chitinophagaceae bacterium]